MTKGIRDWIEIYRHHDMLPEDEGFACKGCGAKDNHSHKDGPANDACKCDPQLISVPSKTFIENWELIKWNHMKNH